MKNSGSVSGDEVVQLYVSQRGRSVSQPVRELKGFQRVTLAPGASEHVEFTLTRDELAFWNIDLKDVVEPGPITIWVAGSTIYHTIAATMPQAEVMGAIGLVALAANLTVAFLLYKYRTGDSQAMSVWLCTRNDCIVNIAVMMAGAGVWASGTPWPDIAVAAIVACLGISSAVRIIRQALGEIREISALHGAPAE